MPADLTLVWNPASDSILSRQIIGALDQWKTQNTRPLFVSVTSTADGATAVIFPIATKLSAISKAFPRVGDPGTNVLESEGNYYTSTPGHKPELINRDAVPIGMSIHPPPGTTATMLNLSHNLKGDVIALPSESGGVELWELQHRRAAVDVPYWNIQVDERIIKNHGDVWNPKAEALLAGLFRIANPLNPARGRREATFTTRDFHRNQYKQPAATGTVAPLKPERR